MTEVILTDIIQSWWKQKQNSNKTERGMKMRKMRSKLWMLLFAAVFSILFSVTAFAAIEVTMSGTSNYADAYEALQVTNEQRTAAGKKPLNMNKQLQEAAMQRAWETAMLVGHERPDGSAIKTAIDTYVTSYTYTKYGENIAYGYSSGSSVVNNGWMQSTTGHKETMLSDSYTQIGIGCYVHNGTYYWVQLFTNGKCTNTVSKKANSKTMTKKVSVDQSNLRLWGSRDGSVLCLRGQTINIEQNEYEKLVPVHYNNEGLSVILYASDFTWMASNSASENIAIIDHSGAKALVMGLKTGMVQVDMYDGEMHHMLNVNIYHNHTPGAAATCTKAQTCTSCGKTLVKALGHSKTGGCTTNVTCSRCGIVISGPVGHKPGAAATCTTSQKCTKCGTVLKSQLYHTYPPRNCLKELHCSRCGYMRYKAYEKHYWSSTKTFYKAATVKSPALYKQKCLVCDEYKLVKSGSKLKATLKLNLSNITLKKNQSFTGLKATMANGDTVKSVKSSKTSVLKVTGFTKKGTIKLKAGSKTGTAKLTVETAAGAKKTITVKVQNGTVKTTKIKNVSSNLTMKKGAVKTLKPVLQPLYSTQKLTYKSSNEAVVTVNSSGKLTAKKKGTATITVKSGSVTVKCKVTVK